MADEDHEQRQIQDVVRDINKKMKEQMLLRGADLRARGIERVSTGLASLDFALGGGFPNGRWVELYGKESSGKSALAFQLVAHNQRVNPNWDCLWVAAEEFVPSYAEMFGVDVDRLWIANTNIMEDAYQAIVDVMDARSVDCVVLDSLPALVPITESEDGVEDMQVAIGARVTGKFFRKVLKAGRRSLTDDDRHVLGIIVNQTRVDVGGFSPVPGQSAITTPGGTGKNFFYFVRCEVKATGALKDGSEFIGQTIRVRTIKNKTYPPRRDVALDFYFDSGFDKVKDLYTIAKELGAISRKGAWYSIPNVDMERIQTKEAFWEAFVAHPEWQEQAHTNLMELLNA